MLACVQVDAWAVGILAYELLVGYPPFEQESRAATYEHIMYKDPKFPSWMSEDAKKFIACALCKVRGGCHAAKCSLDCGTSDTRPTQYQSMMHHGMLLVTLLTCWRTPDP